MCGRYSIGCKSLFGWAGAPGALLVLPLRRNPLEQAQGRDGTCLDRSAQREAGQCGTSVCNKGPSGVQVNWTGTGSVHSPRWTSTPRRRARVGGRPRSLGQCRHRFGAIF
jgi:surface antigen